MAQIEALWQAIRQEAAIDRIAEGEFKLVRIDPSHPFEIYAGMDGAGSVMIAVGVTSRPPLIDADTGAVSYIRVPRAGGSWIVALRLGVAELEQVFGRLCQDLIDAATHVATETALVALFRERIVLWKRLFRDSSSGLLQKFQIKGLVAELLALETFLYAQAEDPALPLMSWLGPSGADHDFRFVDRAVEIKAVSPGAEKVSISSVEQMCADVPLELRLYVLRESSPSELGAISLPILVSRIEHRLSAHLPLLSIFRSKLIEAGYVEHEYYLNVAFTVIAIQRYSVGENFPRIVSSELHNAITDVTYSIRLPAIAQFQIQENTDAS